MACDSSASKVAQQLKQAKACYFEGDFDKTISLCNAVLSSDSSNTTAYLFRGSAKIKKRNLDRAIEDFDRLIQLDSQNADAFLCRGYARLLKGENDEAINDYTTAIQIDPRMTAAYVSRGNVLRGKEQFDDAITDFNKALQIYAEDAETTPPDANLVEAYCGRGHTLVAKGNYFDANEDFLQALRVDPTDLGACVETAWFRATCPEDKYRNGKEAVEFATKACELSKWKDGAYIDTLAAAYAEAGDWENAVLKQEQAIELAADESNKAERQERLELYRRKVPYRTKPQGAP